MTKKKITRICSVENCERSGTIVKTMCMKHYNRTLLNGHPKKLFNNCGKGDTPEERFWSRVDLTANSEKCWIWQGSKIKGGYGRLNFKGKHWKAHRLAWFLVNERTPQKFLLHSCDTPACVNPNHLREGTLQDNMDDMVKRGRSLTGARNHKAKFTEDQVRKIKQRLSKGEKPASLAREFNVNHSTIARMKRGETWQ